MIRKASFSLAWLVTLALTSVHCGVGTSDRTLEQRRGDFSTKSAAENACNGVTFAPDGALARPQDLRAMAHCLNPDGALDHTIEIVDSLNDRELGALAHLANQTFFTNLPLLRKTQRALLEEPDTKEAVQNFLHELSGLGSHGDLAVALLSIGEAVFQDPTGEPESALASLTIRYAPKFVLPYLARLKGDDLLNDLVKGSWSMDSRVAALLRRLRAEISPSQITWFLSRVQPVLDSPEYASLASQFLNEFHLNANDAETLSNTLHELIMTGLDPKRAPLLESFVQDPERFRVLETALTQWVPRSSPEASRPFLQALEQMELHVPASDVISGSLSFLRGATASRAPSPQCLRSTHELGEFHTAALLGPLSARPLAEGLTLLQLAQSLCDLPSELTSNLGPAFAWAQGFDTAALLPITKALLAEAPLRQWVAESVDEPGTHRLQIAWPALEWASSQRLALSGIRALAQLDLGDAQEVRQFFLRRFAVRSVAQVGPQDLRSPDFAMINALAAKVSPARWAQLFRGTESLAKDSSIQTRRVMNALSRVWTTGHGHPGYDGLISVLDGFSKEPEQLGALVAIALRHAPLMDASIRELSGLARQDDGRLLDLLSKLSQMTQNATRSVDVPDEPVESLPSIPARVAGLQQIQFPSEVDSSVRDRSQARAADRRSLCSRISFASRWDTADVNPGVSAIFALFSSCLTQSSLAPSGFISFLDLLAPSRAVSSGTESPKSLLTLLAASAHRVMGTGSDVARELGSWTASSLASRQMDTVISALPILAERGVWQSVHDWLRNFAFIPHPDRDTSHVPAPTRLCRMTGTVNDDGEIPDVQCSVLATTASGVQEVLRSEVKTVEGLTNEAAIEARITSILREVTHGSTGETFEPDWTLPAALTYAQNLRADLINPRAPARDPNHRNQYAPIRGIVGVARGMNDALNPFLRGGRLSSARAQEMASLLEDLTSTMVVFSYYYPGEFTPKVRVSSLWDLMGLLLINVNFVMPDASEPALIGLGLVACTWDGVTGEPLPHYLSAGFCGTQIPLADLPLTLRLGLPEESSCFASGSVPSDLSTIPTGTESGRRELACITQVRNLVGVPSHTPNGRSLGVLPLMDYLKRNHQGLGLKLTRAMYSSLIESTPEEFRPLFQNGEFDGSDHNLKIISRLAQSGIFRVTTRWVQSIPPEERQQALAELIEFVGFGAASERFINGLENVVIHLVGELDWERSGVWSDQPPTAQMGLWESLVRAGFDWTPAERSRLKTTGYLSARAVSGMNLVAEPLPVLPFLLEAMATWVTPDQGFRSEFSSSLPAFLKDLASVEAESLARGALEAKDARSHLQALHKSLVATSSAREFQELQFYDRVWARPREALLHPKATPEQSRALESLLRELFQGRWSAPSAQLARRSLEAPGLLRFLVDDATQAARNHSFTPWLSWTRESWRSVSQSVSTPRFSQNPDARNASDYFEGLIH